MDECALILSIIAIVISLFDIYNNHRVNKTSIKSEYFSELYQAYLFTKIPEARRDLRVDNGKFVDFEYLQNTITDMVYKLVFFKYADERFYKKLKEKCFNLEDYLLNAGNKKNVDISTILEEIDNQLRKIYQLINKKHENG